MSERSKAIVVLVCVVVVMAVTFMMAFGLIDADNLSKAVSAVLAMLTAVLAWWRNNNVTDAAAKAQDYLNKLKAGE